MNTANIEPHKIVGLALSGGFIRTTACIGAIEVLEENGIPIDIISGCSSGSAVAAAYAAGTMPQLKKRLIEGRRRDYFKVIIEPTIPRDGFLKGERNRKFFEEFVGDKNFSDLNKKTILMATFLIYDFVLSYYHPDDARFAKNALVFAPDTTIIESLKEIKTFDYSKVLPKEYQNILVILQDDLNQSHLEFSSNLHSHSIS